MLWERIEGTEDQELQLEWKWLQSIAIAVLLPISDVFVPLLAALLIIRVFFRHGWQAVATPVNRAYFGLSVWMILTTIIAFDIRNAAGGLVNFLPYFLLAASTSYIVRTPKQFIHFLWLLVLNSIFVSGFGILQAIINRPDLVFINHIQMGFSPDHRIQSFFGHFNEAAAYLLTIIPIAFHFAIGKVKSISKSQKWIALIALALAICVLILTSSRNAWVLAILGFVAIALYYRQWKLAAVLGLLMLLIAWAVFGQKFGLGGEVLRSLLPEGFVNRLASTVDPKFSDYASTADRLNAWQFAISLISQHPIQGWGLQNFQLIAKSVGYDLRGLPHEHNLFLAIAVGSGIPALLGFVGIIIWTIWTSLKSAFSQQTEGTMVIAAISIVICLQSGWLDIVFYEPRVSMLLWLLIGSMYGLAKSSQLIQTPIQG